uniref:Exportin-T n=1 Tax=Kwoniella bestiolae CBS 10118 TaxID=1296100 RepID=A0A1B9FUN9_9TREE|nr:exportin-T [Kwoniella bestiolae CBS 10118]OCF22482.1 exportin-T [Kwoniella bestiolae CBS 10118]
MASSSHLNDIPQAVRIAASTDSNVNAELKQQAIDYLTKVKQLSQETWQDCLALYLQGAGAPGPSNPGKDGKEKLETDLRMFCEQVVDTALTQRSSDITSEAQQAMYNAVIEFVQTEYVQGSCESGQAFLRNKLAFTIAHLFLNAFPTTIPTFLRPLFSLLTVPPAAPVNFHPALLTLRVLTEIAQEVHDVTLRSARKFSKDRQQRDGEVRDVIRSSGDERIAVEGMLDLVEKGLDMLEQGGEGKWLEVVETALKTMVTWTPWVDLGVSLQPKSLALYHRLLRSSHIPLRTATANIIKSLAAKGVQDPQARLEVLRVLNLVSLVDPLESETRGVKDNEEVIAFRAAVASILATFGTELIGFFENTEIPEPLRNEAESMMTVGLPLLLRFLSDRQYEVPIAVAPFASDLLRVVTGQPQPPAPSPPPPLTPQRREFLASMLDILIRQLAWPDDAEWEAPGSDEDSDDEMALFRTFRVQCRAYIESIAQIEKGLHTEVVARIVVATLDAYQAGGASAVPWQQAELALHLIYTFGELSKSNTRAGFYDLPPEVATKAARDKVYRASVNKSISSGRSTPTSDIAEPEVDYGTAKENFDYDQYPLSPLGELLKRCMASGISTYPHPSVTLQYFEISVRYVEFWKYKAEAIQPMFEAILDGRGVHHTDQFVRRRCFYLFQKLCKDCRNSTVDAMVPPILDSIKDLLVINADVPSADSPDEDPLTKATTGKSYAVDQLYLFEAAGQLIYLTKSDSNKQIPLLEAIAGPLMSGMASGVERFRTDPNDLQAVLQVHHHLMALGHLAKGFPMVSDTQVEKLPYTPAFKQMTEALLQALDAVKTQRVVRDAARFAFAQFVNAIGSTVAELVPRFVSVVVTEYETSELVDFMLFLGLLMHRLKKNTFETMDMLLLPLLSRIFAILQQPITGTDEAQTHARLKDAYLNFFTALMNANLDGVFITERNKPEFENLLTTLLGLTQDCSDPGSQRFAFGFFARSVIAWGTSPEAAAQPSQALPGYENFIYQRLVPACFEVPARKEFNIRSSTLTLFEMAALVRSTAQARGQEAINFLLNDLLPRLNCPPDIANQFVNSLRTQQAKDFRKTYTEFVKAMRG